MLARQALKGKSISRKITTYESKSAYPLFTHLSHRFLFLSLDRGFAFSQEAGNDRIITDRLS